MLRLNDVYNYQNVKFRILSKFSKGYIWINIDSKSALPEYIEQSLLIDLIEAGECFLDTDPFKDLTLIIEEPNSKNAIKRDENFQLIEPIITHPEFHNPSIRGNLVKNILENHKTTKQTIYRLLRYYWQRGQTPNSLLRSYNRKTEVRKIEKKLGRPRKFTEGQGAIITDEIKRLFNIVINQNLLNKKQHSLIYAYRQFQLRFKSLYPVIADEDIPTIRQFKYFYDKQYGQSDKVVKRTEKKIYDKDIRQLKSTVNTYVLGTGSKYEIDATIADIYLLSDSDRQSIVGRPIVYLVVDVFSRMVTGFYIGFENTSYVTAMQAFKVAVTDKVELCRKFDIEIKTEDWPCVGLPEAILADRGELLGYQVETIEKNFSIRIENTPAYRGDLKGIVERYFRTIQAKFKPFTAGFGLVQGVKEVRRGGHDYRHDATLTISDFTKIIINSIIIHNTTQQLVKYDREPDMPPDMPLIPINIWYWGIQNRTGKLRSVDADVLSIALLPRQKATMSDLGLKVFGVYYHCKEVTEKGWLHRKSSVSRPKFLEVGYELSDASKIYIFYEENSLKYWEATLSDRSREFEGCNWWEVWQIQSIQKSTLSKQTVKSNLALAELDKKNLEIIELAKQRKNPSKESRASQISKIKENRQKERNLERTERKPYVQLDKPNLRIIKNTTIDVTDEDIALKNPIYKNLLFEDE